MNRKAIAIGAVAAGLLALATFTSPFGASRAPLAPLDEPEAESRGRGPRAPVEAPAPGAPSKSGGSARVPSAGPPHEPVADGPAIHGVVVDGATGEPIAGATIDVGPASPDTGASIRARREPRVPIEAQDSGGRGRASSSPTGRFAAPWRVDATAHVIASAPGHLGEVRTAVTVDDDIRLSLRPGTAIRGRVRRAGGLPIEGATIRALTTPNEPTPSRPLESTARSADDGTFEVLGLPGVVARIVFEHPDYMPASAQATPGGPPIDVTMAAAFRAWFRVRAADGGSPLAPLVQWTRTNAAGRPIQVGAEDFDVAADASPSGPPTDALDAWGPVRVPTEPAGGAVRFVVAVPGRLAWASDEIAMPANGAERTIDLALERDPAAGSLSVRVVDPEGHHVALPSDDVIVHVRRTDGPSRTPRAIVRAGELAFDGLPAGSYDVFATHRRFGAASVATTVEGGREARVEVRLAAPASLRVTIHTDTKRRVQFQLLREGSAVPAFEDPPPKEMARSAAPGTSRVHFLAGPDGILLRGLAAGRYAVHVVSPDLAADDVGVEVTVGGTAEITAHATPR